MKRRVIQHYEILRRLGAGGSGVVYLANDTMLTRPVVLKILRRGLLTQQQMRSTILREARLASAIEHPNVCAIYEVGESGEEAYIVMQFVPGQSLDALIARGASSVQLVLSVGIQIADGLHAAHSLGIFHRDLKPQNVMLTDGGLVKILDFGLARRLRPEDAAFDPAKPSLPRDASVAETYTARGGTLRYMAPEQFVTGQSSVQSDVWALGVLLYEFVSGRHPFARPDAEDFQIIRAIQFVDPPDLSEIVPDILPEMKSVIANCLEKHPAARYASAAEVREALKTIMKAMQLETGAIPGDAAANLIPSGPEGEKRATSFLSMLAERFREASSDAPRQNSIVVLPFHNLGGESVAPLYGYALADAIAARLARLPSLVVRPSSSLMSLGQTQLDPLAVGQRLLVSHVLAGNFMRSQNGFDLNWQLLDIESQSVRSGGSIQVDSFDLIAVQNELSSEVFAAFQAIGGVEPRSASTELPAQREGSLPESLTEEYLQARALLTSFMTRTGSRSDLERATMLFERVTVKEPQFAAGWSGLGIAELQYARHGFAGQAHLMRARHAFDHALEIDPDATEANLYRVYLLLTRGDKESARHGIANLLGQSGNDWSVHLVAGITLRLDGVYDAALAQFSHALKLNPSGAAILYNHRARVYQYENQLDIAGDELAKGLALEPKHPLLRTSSAYQHMRLGNVREAISILEEVIQDDTSMRIAVPTLALCYVQAGERALAATLLREETLTAAEADSEMAYRLATYFAVEGDSGEALHWLRRAIYLGNENYPWFQLNPAWNNLRTNADFSRILDDLKKAHRRNQKTWRRLLEESAAV